MTATQIPLFTVQAKPEPLGIERTEEGRAMIAAMRAETQALLDLCNSFGEIEWGALPEVPTAVLRHASELFYRGRYKARVLPPRRAASSKPIKQRRLLKQETLHRIRIGKLLKRAEKHYPLLPGMRSQFLQDSVGRNPSYYGMCQIAGESCPVPDLKATAKKRAAIAREQELLRQEAEQHG
jgi:hypothetical protein